MAACTETSCRNMVSMSQDKSRHEPALLPPRCGITRASVSHCEWLSAANRAHQPAGTMRRCAHHPSAAFDRHHAAASQPLGPPKSNVPQPGLHSRRGQAADQPGNMNSHWSLHRAAFSMLAHASCCSPCPPSHMFSPHPSPIQSASHTGGRSSALRSPLAGWVAARSQRPPATAQRWGGCHASGSVPCAMCGSMHAHHPATLQHHSSHGSPAAGGSSARGPQ